jgi:hypothetical protein
MERPSMLVDVRIDIVKMAKLLKPIYVFNAIPIKILMRVCTEIEKSILKYIWKHKRSRIAKAILNKNSNARDITIPDFKLYYRAIIKKNSLVLAQKQIGRSMDQNSSL